MIADLWTAHDFIEGTAAWSENHGLKPDVVILPSSFLSLGARDL